MSSLESRPPYTQHPPLTRRRRVSVQCAAAHGRAVLCAFGVAAAADARCLASSPAPALLAAVALPLTALVLWGGGGG